jgi:phosphatidylserine/phosphatidylglycerophosphate/cardiolipin synthase-like enzyme
VQDKLLVLDDQVTIGGSYTGPANQFNEENLFMITNAQVAQHMRLRWSACSRIWRRSSRDRETVEHDNR